jgi:hypothetical protein
VNPKPKKQPRRPAKETGAFSDGTVVTICDRDQGRCAACGTPVVGTRGVTWAVHHRRPRGSGGTSEKYVARPSNGVLLHTSCHERKESHRDEATTTGFLVSAIGIARPSDVPILHAVHGWVRLDDDGGYTRVKVTV